MPSPFPGMNPYLEHPSLWSGVHHRLITAIANDLAPQIRPKYIVAVEERVYQMSGEESLLIGIPDVLVQRVQTANNPIDSSIAIVAPSAYPLEATIPLLETLTEGYLEIRAVETEEVITVIEILSPKDKQSAVGRLQYQTKRQMVLGSLSHLLEIDLLRQGIAMPILSPKVESDYRILVSRSDTRPQAELYAFNLPDRIPQLRLPLRSEDAEPLIDLQSLVHEIYDQGGYDLRLDYSRKPMLTLSERDDAWVDRMLREQGLRS